MQNDFQLKGASWHYVGIGDYVEGGEKWGMRGQLIPLWPCKDKASQTWATGGVAKKWLEFLKYTLNLGHVGHVSSYNV